MRLCSAALLLLCAYTPAIAGTCVGVNSRTGQSQSVRELYWTAVSHPRRYFAEATHHGATGRPLTVYYRRYSTAPAYFKRFIRNHECCHHNGHKNEIAANCCVLRRMGLSASGLAAVRTYIVSKEVNSETVVDYAGQGSLFWSKTASRCLGHAAR